MRKTIYTSSYICSRSASYFGSIFEECLFNFFLIEEKTKTMYLPTSKVSRYSQNEISAHKDRNFKTVLEFEIPGRNLSENLMCVEH